MRHAAHADTGGFTPEKAHSYAGSWPFGCVYHSRDISTSCSFAKVGSTFANGIMWNARSHAAYHGYSHLSGMLITSRLNRWPQSRFRPSLRRGGGAGWS